MRGFLQDLRFALRGFRRSPGFTAVAVATLAIGLGANTAIFSVAKSVLLDPLPFPESSRLVRVAETYGDSEISVSYPNYLDWRDQNRSFTSLAAFCGESGTLSADPPERLNVHVVSGNFFPTLGVSPSLGRALVPADDAPGAPPVVVISHALWQRQFGGDPSVVGRAVTIDGTPRTVVGVASPKFRFYDYGTPDLWTPLGPWARDPNSDVLARRSHAGLYALGRLRPDVSLAQARSEMAGLRNRLARAYPDDNGVIGIRLESFRESVVGDTRPAIAILSASVALLLLIACANISNLLLARGAERRRELAVRTALGARRGTLVAQLLTESVLLAAAGAAAGAALAAVALRTIVSSRPIEVPRLDETALDFRVFAVLAAAAVASGVLAGLLPAWRASRPADLTALRVAAHGSEGGRLQAFLIAGQSALCIVLLAGSGLLVRSFWKLRRVDPGFSTAGVLTARLDAPESGGAPDPRFFPAVLEAARRMPGVASASAVAPLPLAPANRQESLFPEGRPASRERPTRAQAAIVDPDYFQTMRIPILRGRGLAASDDAQRPAVAVVSAAAARRFWPGEDPIGRRFSTNPLDPAKAPSWTTVVGVVGDIRLALDGSPTLQVYHPAAQRAMGSLTLLLRSDGRDPRSLVEPLAAAVRRVDRNQPLYRIATLDDVASQSVAERRFAVVLLAGFTAAGLLLAAAGIGGLVARFVTSRRREIGIRMALGARASAVVAGVMRTALLPVAVGIAVGLAGTLLAAPALRSLLFGIAPVDPATFVSIPVLLAAVAAAAAVGPAARAARIDPMSVLREE